MRNRLGVDIARTQQQLATGKRINRAEDDPAGFSLSVKLNARIASLTQALQNVGDAKSVLEIAEGSLNSIYDRLVEIKKLATQTANEGAYNEENRVLIRNTINSQARAIQTIIDQTTYNGINLLDGMWSPTFQIGAGTSDTLNFAISVNLSPEDTRVSEVTSRGSWTSAGPITAATTLNALDQFAGLQAGDTFDVTVTADDGTQTVTTITATGSKGAPATTTVGDVLAAINATPNINAFLDASGNIMVQEITPTDGNLLAVSINNFVEAAAVDGATGTLSFSFQATSGGMVTSFTSGGPIGGGTLLNDLDQFSDLEGGDTITINLAARDGSTALVSYTLPGGIGNASTATISTLAAAITAQGGGKFQATVNGSGQILIKELNLAQGAFGVSASFIEFSNGDAVTPSPVFTFTYGSDGMNTTILDNTLSPAGAGTQLNDLNGFGNLHGGDIIRFTITNRAGISQQFDFVLNDVGDGVLSTRTLGELVSFLDGQTVGGITMSVSLDGAGQLSVVEDNTPQLGLSASGSFSELNLDIIPKAFPTTDFAISDFLPLTAATGLVVGFGLESFNDNYVLTDEIARFLIRNVDQSISRVASLLNDIGVFQTRLTNREYFLTSAIISNEQAKSRIMDADYAKVKSRAIAQEILLRFQNFALTQANLTPRSLLRTLG